MKNQLIQYGMAGIAFMMLSACGDGSGVRDALGINSRAPDEFVVVSRAPLSVPPEFDLKPPVPGAPKQRNIEVREQARGVVFKNGKKRQPLVESSSITAVTGVEAEDLPSAAESTFFGKLQMQKADPDIRVKLGEDAEREIDTSNEKTLLDKLRKEDDDQPVVDAFKEAERIRNNKDNDIPINEGEIPTEEPKGSSLLDKLL